MPSKLKPRAARTVLRAVRHLEGRLVAVVLRRLNGLACDPDGIRNVVSCGARGGVRAVAWRLGVVRSGFRFKFNPMREAPPDL